MFKRLRILILLFILITVALGNWRTESRLKDWQNSVHVTVYPLAGDDSPVTRDYLSTLRPTNFEALEKYFGSEASRLGLPLLKPVALELAPTLRTAPPSPPEGGDSALTAIVWSLRMRYWAWRHDEAPGPKPDIRLFLVYHDPSRRPTLPHSTGLREGRMALVQVFASPADQGGNQVVTAHELLHTLGATDKYDPETLMPRFPDGFAEPTREPRIPQERAELMAGRIPVGAQTADIPTSLAQTLIGPATAREIGWTHGR
ncbi:MAG: hypothetical protein JNJ44_11075 [Zoogloeaceae bacterium]|nr:hypothetical protein [Zoogloeaceae bacterium]